MSVEQLLADSIAAHGRYRQAHDARDTAGMRAAIDEAQRLRAAAVDADPDKTSPGWAANEGRYPHAALLHFYAEYLAR